VLFGTRREHNPDAAQTYPGEFVSGNYFETSASMHTLTVCSKGATIARNAPPVVVMSYRLWRMRMVQIPRSSTHLS
jgi:hypothetical protein